MVSNTPKHKVKIDCKMMNVGEQERKIKKKRERRWERGREAGAREREKDSE
jgi:hypothetical protein